MNEGKLAVNRIAAAHGQDFVKQGDGQSGDQDLKGAGKYQEQEGETQPAEVGLDIRQKPTQVVHGLEILGLECGRVNQGQPSTGRYWSRRRGLPPPRRGSPPGAAQVERSDPWAPSNHLEPVLVRLWRPEDTLPSPPGGPGLPEIAWKPRF